MAVLAQSLRRCPGKLRTLSGVTLSMVDSAAPLNLQGASNEDMLWFYRDLAPVPPLVWRRCRVLLLGDGGVGKTTLAHRLTAGDLIAPTPAVTHGVLQRELENYWIVLMYAVECNGKQASGIGQRRIERLVIDVFMRWLWS
jgi:hypothetical protein